MSVREEVNENIRSSFVRARKIKLLPHLKEKQVEGREREREKLLRAMVI